MSGQKTVQNSLEKLDVVWSSVKDSSLKNYEYILLRHLLGDKQDNLFISIIHKSIYDEIDIAPEILYLALVKGVSKLLSRAYSNTIKYSATVNDLTESNKVLQSNLKSSNQMIARLDAECNKLLNQITSLQGMIKDMEDEIYELEVENSRLQNKNNELQKNLDIEKARIRMDKSSGLELDMEKEIQKNIVLSNENTDLEKKIKLLDNLLSGYKKNEKQLLPLLQQTAYCKEHVGKSITLVPSQIENIIRGYLNGSTPYRISKDLGVSKTSVNKILSCDYRTVNSLKKILDALHSINGNWGSEKKKELDDLISNYKSALKQAEEKAEILRGDINNRISDIDGYFQEINWKQK